VTTSQIDRALCLTIGRLRSTGEVKDAESFSLGAVVALAWALGDLEQKEDRAFDLVCEEDREYLATVVAQEPKAGA
jgi:hypothetical protein